VDALFEVEDFTNNEITRKNIFPMSFSFDEAIELDQNNVER